MLRALFAGFYGDVAHFVLDAPACHLVDSRCVSESGCVDPVETADADDFFLH